MMIQFTNFYFFLIIKLAIKQLNPFSFKFFFNLSEKFGEDDN